MKIFLLFVLMMNAAEARKTLLLVGGGTRPPEAMQKFVQFSGGTHSKILIFSWASQNQIAALKIQEELQVFGPKKVDLAPPLPLSEKMVHDLKRSLAGYTGIFFSGGNQNVLMKALLENGLKPLLKDLYDSGVTFGGTSAGTAIMSERMISGDASPLTEGLGLLSGEIIVDQHFLVRNRLGRLSDLVLLEPNTLGIGIDEGTSLLITNQKFARVIGPSSVLLISKTSNQILKIETYYPNDLFNLFHQKDLVLFQPL